MFPALTQAWREFRDGMGAEPIQLGLKDAGDYVGLGGIGFDPVSVGAYARNGYSRMHGLLGGGSPSWSGESVSEQTADNHSVVWACKRIISESVAFMPLAMMQEVNGVKSPAESHPLHSALRNAPNAEMTTMGFRETLTAHVVMRGNGYARIVRRSGTGVAQELYPLMPDAVSVERDRAGRLVYDVAGDRAYTLDRNKPQDILHIRGLGNDGIRGYSVLSAARQSIGTALAAERNVGSFYANGGRLPYLLKMPHRFKTDQDAERFRSDWQSTYSVPHKAPILDNGLEYQQIGLTAADAQLLESRQFSIPDICRWFLVSPHLVGDLSRATFSNIEQLALEFVKMTLTAWITRWEQELWRCALTPSEKVSGRYYFKHNVNGLLRGDFASRMAGYATQLQNGIASVNEIRDLEDWNAIDGGDDHHIQLNMQALPAQDMPILKGDKSNGK